MSTFRAGSQPILESVGARAAEIHPRFIVALGQLAGLDRTPISSRGSCGRFFACRNWIEPDYD